MSYPYGCPFEYPYRNEYPGNEFSVRDKQNEHFNVARNMHVATQVHRPIQLPSLPNFPDGAMMGMSISFDTYYPSNNLNPIDQLAAHLATEFLVSILGVEFL